MTAFNIFNVTSQFLAYEQSNKTLLEGHTVLYI
jgi:hypothetical protein